MTTTQPSRQRCPGNELNKSLQTVSCACAACGTQNEIFSDELNKSHACTNCGKPLSMDKCTPDAGA